MIVIPAIDIINGSCVRLTRGDYNLKKKYFSNPLKAAQQWKDKGASWLHIVDLDGARIGTVKNLNIAEKIKQNIDIKIQYGGGIRDIGILKEVLESGVDRAVLGTKVIEDKQFLKTVIEDFKNKTILSLDYGKDGLIFKDGWQKGTEIKLFDFAKELEVLGVKEIIITDILRDGTLKGSNFKFIKKLLENLSLEIIVAGGISTISDITNIKKLEKKGIKGIIIGKALYEGKIDLKKAIEIGTGQ